MAILMCYIRWKDTKPVTMVILALFIGKIVAQYPELTPRTPLLPEGVNLTLTCTGSTQYQYTKYLWTRNGLAIKWDDVSQCKTGDIVENRYVTSCQSNTIFTLTILSFTWKLDHNTTWQCRTLKPLADGQFSHSNKIITFVIIPPQLPVISKTNTSNGKVIVWGKTSSQLTLECISRDGYPQQTVTWYNGSVSGTALPSNISVTQSNGTFTVWSNYTFTPTQADDKTTYICQSSSNSTQIQPSNASVELHLVVPPQTPEITNATTGKTADALLWGQDDSPLTIKCVSRKGYPQQTVNLSKNTLTDPPLQTTESVSEDSNGLFTVFRYYTFTPTPSDNGTTYICQSSSINTLIEHANTTLELLVEIPPKEAPEILDTNTTETGQHVKWGHEGMSLTLQCLSMGAYPLQTVKWYTDHVEGSPLESIETVIEGNGTFTVLSNYTFIPTRADEGRMYVCQSKSGIWNKTALTTVQIHVIVETDVTNGNGNMDDGVTSQPVDAGLIGGSVGGGVVGLILMVLLVILLVRRANAADAGGLPQISGYRTRYVRRGDRNPANIDAMVAKVADDVVEAMAEPGTSQVPRNEAIYLHPINDDDYAIIEDQQRTIEVVIEARGSQAQALDIDDTDEPEYLPMDNVQAASRARDMSDTNDTHGVDTPAIADGGEEPQAYVNAAAADILTDEQGGTLRSIGGAEGVTTPTIETGHGGSSQHQTSTQPSKSKHDTTHLNTSQYMDMASATVKPSEYPTMDKDTARSDPKATEYYMDMTMKAKQKLVKSGNYIDMSIKQNQEHINSAEYMDMAEKNNQEVTSSEYVSMATSVSEGQMKSEYVNTVLPNPTQANSDEYVNTVVYGAAQETSVEYVDMTKQSSKVRSDHSIVTRIAIRKDGSDASKPKTKQSNTGENVEYVIMSKRSSKDNQERPDHSTLNVTRIAIRNKGSDRQAKTQQSHPDETNVEYVEMSIHPKDKVELEALAKIKQNDNDKRKAEYVEMSIPSEASETAVEYQNLPSETNEPAIEYQNLQSKGADGTMESGTENVKQSTKFNDDEPSSESTKTESHHF